MPKLAALGHRKAGDVMTDLGTAVRCTSRLRATRRG
jgi:hypothetical protein